MLTDAAIEIVSPLNHFDTDCVCRIAKTPGLVATCAGCGQTVYRRVHLPLITFGFWCGACCPCKTFVPTPAEEKALRINRAMHQRDAGDDDAPKSVPVVAESAEAQAERRERMRQRCADAVRARWADPGARAKMLDGMKKRTR